MRRTFPASLAPVALCLTSALCLAGADARSESVRKDAIVPAVGKPRVEMVFALDTTGSMGGLIDGAKRKIWYIANEVQKAKQRPEVKVGLVAYRDRGDAYVTQVLPLTTDLDKVYETLMAYGADGGGDTPEDVNSALNDALTKMQWSAGKDTLKMIFLVGDAPPQTYNDTPSWKQTAQAAVRKDIYINTIQCGGDPSTTTTWKEIAHAAEGRFAQIAQDGGVAVAMVTPFDADLSHLARELDKTYLTYGAAPARKAKEESRARAGALAAAPAMAPVAADRAAAKASAARSDGDDLIDLAEAKGGAVRALESVSVDALPDELRGKNNEEQKKIIEGKKAQRELLQRQIVELQKKREAHLAASTKASPASKDAFDAEVVDAIHAQAVEAGLSY